jgi:hypothetical protein
VMRTHLFPQVYPQLGLIDDSYWGKKPRFDAFNLFSRLNGLPIQGLGNQKRNRKQSAHNVLDSEA